RVYCIVGFVCNRDRCHRVGRRALLIGVGGHARRGARISAKVLRNGYIGTVIWDGKDYRFGKLLDIPYHLEIKVGDTVVTSGYSTVFPENVQIGTVQGVKPNINDNFYDLKVQFFTDFNRISEVYVVKNNFKTEIDSLTSKYKK
ncbi:MAG: rod shape-determining protein MreC, partial [Bacteroidales bacterium]|nr:rod shape-determining protein MreC [Bacteroidales bacterium]